LLRRPFFEFPPLFVGGGHVGVAFHFGTVRLLAGISAAFDFAPPLHPSIHHHHLFLLLLLRFLLLILKRKKPSGFKRHHQPAVLGLFNVHLSLLRKPGTPFYFVLLLPLVGGVAVTIVVLSYCIIWPGCRLLLCVLDEDNDGNSCKSERKESSSFLGFFFCRSHSPVVPTVVQSPTCHSIPRYWPKRLSQVIGQPFTDRHPG
jgi:hypothetical protein